MKTKNLTNSVVVRKDLPEKMHKNTTDSMKNKVLFNTRGCLDTTYFDLLPERVDYTHSIRRANRFGDFLLEGRVIELDFQKEKNIFRCKVSIDPLGIKWVDFLHAPYLPKLADVFFIRSRHWNTRVVRWRNFIWSEPAKKEAKRLLEQQEKELKKNLDSYYNEYGHFELLDLQTKQLEDGIVFESSAETSFEKVKSFNTRNKAVTNTSIYTYKKKPRLSLRRYKYYLDFNKSGIQNTLLSFRKIKINVTARRLIFGRPRRIAFPRVGRKYFFPCAGAGLVKHSVLGFSGFLKFYNIALLSPEAFLLQEDKLFLKHASRKQIVLNSVYKDLFFSTWLDWSLLFLVKTFIRAERDMRFPLKRTKKSVSRLALKVARARVVNKVSQLFGDICIGLNNYDLIRELVSVKFSSPFELFIAGAVINPEERETRSHLPFGYYRAFKAKFTFPRSKKVSRPLPALSSLRILSKKRFFRGVYWVSLRFWFALALRKEFLKVSLLRKSFCRNTRRVPFQWSVFSSFILNRLQKFKYSSEKSLIQRNKFFFERSLIKVLSRKLGALVDSRVKEYLVLNRTFFKAVWSFFFDFGLSLEKVVSLSNFKRKPNRFQRFRSHGSVLGVASLDPTFRVLKKDKFFVSFSFLKEIVSARTQFFLLSDPRSNLMNFYKRARLLISKLGILDNIFLYTSVIPHFVDKKALTFKQSKSLKKVLFRKFKKLKEFGLTAPSGMFDRLNSRMNVGVSQVRKSVVNGLKVNKTNQKFSSFKLLKRGSLKREPVKHGGFGFLFKKRKTRSLVLFINVPRGGRTVGCKRNCLSFFTARVQRLALFNRLKLSNKSRVKGLRDRFPYILKDNPTMTFGCLPYVRSLVSDQKSAFYASGRWFRNPRYVKRNFKRDKIFSRSWLIKNCSVKRLRGKAVFVAAVAKLRLFNSLLNAPFKPRLSPAKLYSFGAFSSVSYKRRKKRNNNYYNRNNRNNSNINNNNNNNNVIINTAPNILFTQSNTNPNVNNNGVMGGDNRNYKHGYKHDSNHAHKRRYKRKHYYKRSFNRYNNNNNYNYNNYNYNNRNNNNNNNSYVNARIKVNSNTTNNKVDNVIVKYSDGYYHHGPGRHAGYTRNQHRKFNRNTLKSNFKRRYKTPYNPYYRFYFSNRNNTNTNTNANNTNTNANNISNNNNYKNNFNNHYRNNNNYKNNKNKKFVQSSTNFKGGQNNVNLKGRVSAYKNTHGYHAKLENKSFNSNDSKNKSNFKRSQNRSSDRVHAATSRLKTKNSKATKK